MEEEGRTIFLPKGHFFSLWLPHKDHLRGSLNYHSSIHSAKGPCEQRAREGSPSKQKRALCVSGQNLPSSGCEEETRPEPTTQHHLPQEAGVWNGTVPKDTCLPDAPLPPKEAWPG